MNIVDMCRENIKFIGIREGYMSKTMMWFGWLAVNAAAVILGCVYWKHLLVG